MSATGIVQATADFERWLGSRIPLRPDHLERKHERMREDAHRFLRAAFYRWATEFPATLPELASAPAVLGVGDLHVENFGTWRDAEGRLAWGINDFDEACPLPFTSDLVRLATSALLAVEQLGIPVTPRRICSAILVGYTERIDGAGEPFVLADRHSWLRELAVANLTAGGKYWKKQGEKIAAARVEWDEVPAGARSALLGALPAGAEASEALVGAPETGTGSLGRQRYALALPWRGGRIAREAKQLADSAWRWAAAVSQSEPVGEAYAFALEAPARSPDPFCRVSDGWVVRRLSPSSDKLTLEALVAVEKGHDVSAHTLQMLGAMGAETANIHLASGDSVARTVRDRLDRLPDGWLKDAAEAMRASTLRDFEQWRGQSGA